MIELSQQEQQALDASPEPPQLVDPRTNTTYRLIRADQYVQIQALLDEDLTMRQVATLVEEAMREDDANDPTLEFYQHKYGRKS